MGHPISVAEQSAIGRAMDPCNWITQDTTSTITTIRDETSMGPPVLMVVESGPPCFTCGKRMLLYLFSIGGESKYRCLWCGAEDALAYDPEADTSVPEADTSVDHNPNDDPDPDPDHGGT